MEVSSVNFLSPLHFSAKHNCISKSMQIIFSEKKTSMKLTNQIVVENYFLGLFRKKSIVSAQFSAFLHWYYYSHKTIMENVNVKWTEYWLVVDS